MSGPGASCEVLLSSQSVSLGGGRGGRYGQQSPVQSLPGIPALPAVAERQPGRSCSENWVFKNPQRSAYVGGRRAAPARRKM